MNASDTSDSHVPLARKVPRLHQRRWTFTLAATALLLVVLAFAHLWTWGLFDDFTFRPAFADTVAILASGEARQAGLDVYKTNPIDPLGRPHVYGPWWLATGAMGLKVQDAAWIGPALAVAFVLAAAGTLGPRRPLEAAFALALLCCPPVMLGIARGNNDLVVFLLFATAAWLLARRSEVVATGGRALLGLAAVLKLYPFAALPVLLLRDRRTFTDTRVDRASVRRDFWRRLVTSAPVRWFAATLSIALLVVWIWRDDYRQALSVTPNPKTTLAYGWPVTRMTVAALAGKKWGFEDAWFVGVAMVALLLGRRTRQLWTSVPQSGFAAQAFVIGGLAWVLCYFAIRNYPYRLLLILLPARLWLDHSAHRDDNDTGRLQLVMWVVVGWLDVAKRKCAIVAAADPTAGGPGWTMFKETAGFEQGLIAALTICVAISTLGAFVRPAIEAARDLRVASPNAPADPT